MPTNKTLWLFVVLVLSGCRGTPVGQPPEFERNIPASNENNLWYQYNESDTAVVFVHGFFSDSRDCWRYVHPADRSRNQYWPQLVAADPRFRHPSVYLGGYYSAMDSGDEGISNAAQTLKTALTTPDAEGRPAPLSKKHIIFVAHSLGGAVVRYLLDSSTQLFSDKTVGVALVASPSGGSKLADRLQSLANLYHSEFGKELTVKSKLLEDLDRRFRDLVHEKRLPYLSGVEAYEHHFVVHSRWFPDSASVVDASSAGRYFGAPHLLENTDHFSSVKPDGSEHVAHRWLVSFYMNTFEPLVASRAPTVPQRQSVEQDSQGGPMVVGVVQLRGSKKPLNNIRITVTPRDETGPEKRMSGTTREDGRFSIRIPSSPEWRRVDIHLRDGALYRFGFAGDRSPHESLVLELDPIGPVSAAAWPQVFEDVMEAIRTGIEPNAVEIGARAVFQANSQRIATQPAGKQPTSALAQVRDIR